MTLKYCKSEKINLRDHYDKKWLQTRIEDPSLLGLGDVISIQSEGSQSTGVVIKKTLSCLIAISLISILGSTTLLFAESIVWTGLGSTYNWSEPANWDTGTVPLATDDIIFDSTRLKDSIIDSDFGR